MNEKTSIEILISKYLDGVADAEEKAALLAWLNESATHRQEFATLYDIWLSSAAALTDDFNVEAALAQLKAKCDVENLPPEKQAISKHLSIQRRIWQVAASVCLLIAAATGGYMLRQDTTQVSVMNSLLTNSETKGKYTLPDGTTVWLNNNSKLTYPESFDAGQRMVSLEGEALFEVTKDASHPFVVRTKGMDVKVLGTRFLVTNYPNKAMVETVLAEGSVLVEGTYFAGGTTLTPGELIAYNKMTRQTAVRQVDVNDYTNWIQPRLVFDKTALSHIAINLEKWYGVKIVVSSDVSVQVHLSFTVRHESLEDILSYIIQTAPIRYTWQGDTLYLSRKR